ncbi:MAG: ATP synthase subunit I [Deltaproteobacteria bacterium]|nr:ATP synthase subunit I [Deltaproteobacteria bacterium]
MAAILVGLVVAGSVGLGSAKFSLSVLGGGVMGLANLWLWQRIVAGMVGRQQGRTVSMAGVVTQSFMKVVGLLAVFLLVFRSPLDLWGVALGFGVTLIGLLVHGLRQY